MDFVVIGLGLSALALLTGLALLCLVAPRWFRRAGVAQPGDAAFARAQAGVRHALGQGFLCVGAVLLLATLGGISAGLTDKAGAYLIASIATVSVLGLFGWDLLYRRQHPVPRRRPAPARARSAADDTSAPQPAASRPMTSAVATTTVRRRVLPARQRVAQEVRPAAAAPSDAMVEDAPTLEDEQSLAGLPEPVAGTAKPPAAVSTAAAPGQEVHEPSAETGAPENASPGQTGEPVSEESAVEKPADVAAVLPDPLPFEPRIASGAADAAAPVPPGADPELLPTGDDRVIALFPTAAARRGLAITAPTDPDDQS